MEQVEKRKAEYRRKFGSGEQDVTGNILHDLFQNSIGYFFIPSLLLYSFLSLLTNSVVTIMLDWETQLST